MQPHLVIIFGALLASAREPHTQRDTIEALARQSPSRAVADPSLGPRGSDWAGRGFTAKAPAQGLAERVEFPAAAADGELWVATRVAPAKLLSQTVPTDGLRRRRRSAQAKPRLNPESRQGRRVLPLSLLVTEEKQAPADLAEGLAGVPGPQAAGEQRIAVFPPPVSGVVGFLLFVSIALLCLGLFIMALRANDSESEGAMQPAGVARHASPKVRGSLQQTALAERQPASRLTPAPERSPAFGPPPVADQDPSALVAVTATAAPDADGADDTQDGRTAENLCPPLLVPAGLEFVFALPEIVEGERQDESFNVVDLKGAPLSHVVISERQTLREKTGIFLQTLAGQTLAVVHTEQIHTGTGKSPPICWPTGQPFGFLKQDTSGPQRSYKLKHRSGQKLLTFTGSFSEKAITVSNHANMTVAETKWCTLDFDKRAQYYQVRVASHVDAGLIICGLLSIEKMEKRQRGSQSAQAAAEVNAVR